MTKHSPFSNLGLADRAVGFGPGGVTATVAGVSGEHVELYAITPRHTIAVNRLTIGADGYAQAAFK